MRLLINITIFILFSQNVFAHSEHYKNFKSIEMEIFKDEKPIGFSIYEFQKNNDELKVSNNTEFKVKLLGVTVFSISSNGIEIYQNGKLISFKSETYQNDKKKYVDLKFDPLINKFRINGSSYNGLADIENIIGNWWNHEILQSESQISPLSGSIKKQTIEFIGKETISLYGREYKTERFKIKSTEQNLPDDKKLNFDIWYDKETALILKIAYKRLGNWEYRLKFYER